MSRKKKPSGKTQRQSVPPAATAAAPRRPASISAEWETPGDPDSVVELFASSSGVTVSHRPRGMWGQFVQGQAYTWDEWLAHGTVPSGGPADLTARIQALAEALGVRGPR